tara:strand:+ start:280 stop:1026 length:747 start_codon:yes stop_codon:yes gene_type:complete
MIVYLAAYKSLEGHRNKPTKDIDLLSSFWEHKNGRYGDYVLQEKHILDSGAFSAINDKKGKYKNFDWDAYVDKYIAFIKKTKQKLFFELDIDCVVGLKKVEYYRKLMEDKIGIAPIICWHQNRGIDYYIKSCEDYNYVAVGTTRASPTGKKIRSNLAVLKQFIDIAHENKTKIHGLGFTSIPWLSKLKFDSVDSTAWQQVRYGGICEFKNGMIKNYRLKNYRLKNIYDAHIHNFDQWVEFQKYAKYNL